MSEAQHDHSGHPHGHGHNHAHDHLGPVSAGNRRRLAVAALLTCGFMLAEAAGGLFTGSLALLADAGHMLTDSVSLVLAYVAYRMSERPGTSRMTYGFDRLKILVAYTNGLTVFAIALWIVAEAVRRFSAPEVVLGGPMLVIAALGLVVNIVVFLVLHGGERESLNLRGAILHVVGDLLGSVAAIVAAGIILASGWMPADPLLSCLVAVLLLWSAWKLVREAGMILLEGAPADIDRNRVAADLARNAVGVLDIHHMHLWTLDGQQKLATLHARLAEDADAEASIAAIKERLSKAYGIRHATVEVETGPHCPDATTYDETAGKRTRHGTA
jgi:cobalt-zinc-cadmium efflux system protein